MLVSVLLLTLLLTGNANHQNYDTCSRYDTHVHNGDLVTCRVLVCVCMCVCVCVCVRVCVLLKAIDVTLVTTRS